MSYLLEALRKADAERNLGRVPDLQTAPLGVGPAPRRVWPWLLGLLLALAANVVVLIVVFQPRFFQSSETPASSAPVAVIAAPAPVARESVPPLQPTLPSPPPPLSASPAPDPVNPALPAEATPPGGYPTAPTQPYGQTARLLATAPANPPTLSAPPPALPTTVPGLDGQSLATLPELSDLPTEPPSGLPNLNLDVHVYSPLPSKRFVMINSKRYQEGEQLNEGLLLEAITADGAVLSYQGRRFILPVYR